MTDPRIDSFLQYLRGRGVPGKRVGTLCIVMTAGFSAGSGKSRLIGFGSRRAGRAGESGSGSICASICRANSRSLAQRASLAALSFSALRSR